MWATITIFNLMRKQRELFTGTMQSCGCKKRCSYCQLCWHTGSQERKHTLISNNIPVSCCVLHWANKNPLDKPNQKSEAKESVDIDSEGQLSGAQIRVAMGRVWIS